jgi:hypothetical protein
MNQTIMVRFGSVVFDAYYSKWRKQWFMLMAGGREEKIAEPPMWFCDDEYAREHQRDLAKHPRRENPLRIRPAKAEQLTFL